ncbi:unnamed protein product [Parnassius mnemosyne]|uniref:Insulin-like domain-containing protein n=1 Tax=Parnassius mnemosyne TaxID=213953 RepID=A0AAV1L6V9_9NEOP
MKFQTGVVFLCFVCLLQIFDSKCEYAQSYCGRRLASTLAFLCDKSIEVKRSDYRYTSEARGWRWISPHQAKSVSRTKRQIVAECCDKPCTVDELLTYC